MTMIVEALKRPNFVVASTLLLYGVTCISLVGGMIISPEWQREYISTTFLVTVILLPVLSVCIAFSIQVISIYTDQQAREQNLKQQVSFMAALERCQVTAPIGTVFFSYLLRDWHSSMNTLQAGVVTIQKDYWVLCTDLFSLARKCVDCTSVIPVGHWDSTSLAEANSELLKYKQLQIQHLITRDVTVRRTFILDEDSLKDDEKVRQFARIVNEQQREGFEVAAIWLPQISDETLKNRLSRDMASIDGKIVMLGRLSPMNRMVYHYDFFDLRQVKQNPSLFEPCLELFENASEVVGANADPRLLIETYKKKVSELPVLAQKKYEVELAAIKAGERP